MKHKRMTPELLEQARRSDRIKLAVMGVATILVAAAFFASQQQATQYSTQEHDDLPGEVEPADRELAEMRGQIPAFDMPEVLESVRDAEPAERVIFEQRALDVVFDYGRILTSNQYESIGVRTLDPATFAELWAEPGEHRVEPFRARGRIEILRKRRRAEGRPEEYAGSLALESGQHAHFVVLEVPEGLGVGAWARVDGMFLKLYSVEGPSGANLEGPLLCGPELVPSYAPIEAKGAVPTPSLAAVQDDELDNVTGLPEDALWELMALAASPDPGVDWESAPALDGQLMGEILADGAAFRGKPVRLELSKNLGAWTERAGENPLRLERITKGWVGNQTWKGQVPVIYCISPTRQEDLRERYGEASFVEGRGYFFKNYAYEKVDGDLGRVPVFVMDTIRAVSVPEDPIPRRLMWFLLIAVIGMVGLLPILILRDRRKSAELQAELVRRRRARRGSDEATASTS